MHPQQTGAARIEESRILHSAKISRCQSIGSIQPDFVQHSGEIDETFRLLIIRAWNLILHCTKTSRGVLKCQQSTCARRTRPLYKVVDRILSFLQMSAEHSFPVCAPSGVVLRCQEKEIIRTSTNKP